MQYRCEPCVLLAEATMYVLSMPFAEAPPADRPLPAGRAIANTHIKILDAHLQAVPVGASIPLCSAGVLDGSFCMPFVCSLVAQRIALTFCEPALPHLFQPQTQVSY